MKQQKLKYEPSFEKAGKLQQRQEALIEKHIKSERKTGSASSVRSRSLAGNQLLECVGEERGRC